MARGKLVKAKRNILLSFTGFRDPYKKSLIEGQQEMGPILTLVSIQPFDHVVLMSTPKLAKDTEATRLEVSKVSPGTTCEVRMIELDDPTDYTRILNGLRKHIKEILKDEVGSQVNVLLNPGTPQMQVSWILLGGSGELPANLLTLREAAHNPDGKPRVSSLDLSSSEFPTILANFSKLKNISTAPNIDSVREELNIIGTDDTLVGELQKASMSAPYKYPVIIYGETGTGKENTARLIHNLSGRPKEKFQVYNCAELPSNLVESILFGHKKGSFTDAREDKKGLFENADKGTLFLDELGELPLEIQSKLLRVLSEGKIQPIGASTPKDIDVRIVTATNRNLRTMIAEGKFREDLYQRLKTIEIRLPALRERRGDIHLLATNLLSRLNQEYFAAKRLAPATLEKLYHHSWPGNIRGLENTIKRAFIFSGSESVIRPELVELEADERPSSASTDFPTPHVGFSLEKFLDSMRRQYILQAMEIANNNQSKASDLLGCSPQNINNLLKKINQN